MKEENYGLVGVRSAARADPEESEIKGVEGMHIRPE